MKSEFLKLNLEDFTSLHEPDTHQITGGTGGGDLSDILWGGDKSYRTYTTNVETECGDESRNDREIWDRCVEI